MGFNLRWVQLITHYVSSVSFAVLFNGVPGYTFYPQRGVRHGDPLSPYLFILCVETFFSLLRKAMVTKALHGHKACRGAPEISHLFFAEDNVLFTPATEEEVRCWKNVLTCYEKMSGQVINKQKSESVFSPHVNIDR